MMMAVFGLSAGRFGIWRRNQQQQQRISVRNDGGVRRWKSPQGLQVPSGLGTMWGEDWTMSNNTCFLHLEKLHLGSKLGGPGTVGMFWKTPCFGLEAEKPLEERTSGYSDRSFWISLRAGFR